MPLIWRWPHLTCMDYLRSRRPCWLKHACSLPPAWTSTIITRRVLLTLMVLKLVVRNHRRCWYTEIQYLPRKHRNQHTSFNINNGFSERTTNSYVVAIILCALIKQMLFTVSSPYLGSNTWRQDASVMADLHENLHNRIHWSTNCWCDHFYLKLKSFDYLYARLLNGMIKIYFHAISLIKNEVAQEAIPRSPGKTWVSFISFLTTGNWFIWSFHVYKYNNYQNDP